MPYITYTDYDGDDHISEFITAEEVDVWFIEADHMGAWATVHWEHAPVTVPMAVAQRNTAGS